MLFRSKFIHQKNRFLPAVEMTLIKVRMDGTGKSGRFASAFPRPIRSSHCCHFDGAKRLRNLFQVAYLKKTSNYHRIIF